MYFTPNVNKKLRYFQTHRNNKLPFLKRILSIFSQYSSVNCNEKMIL